MIRLFAAIPIPAETAEALSLIQGGIEGVRWRPLEALHITLRFFGAVSEPVAEDLASELERAAMPPFEISLAGTGAFGEADRIRAIWAGVEASEPLARLAARCESAARRAGLEPETRNYAPHVTVAYLRRPDPADVAAWIAAHNLFRVPPFQVQRFGLYSSWPGEEGSRYELERLYRLV
jgi:2'-5' RNA ligase